MALTWSGWKPESVNRAAASNGRHCMASTAYRALAARGFVGPEARLAWIEAVQLANRDAGLYGLDYRMAPRVPDKPELAQGLPLGHTIMTLSFPVLVETDLPRFLAALKSRAPGLMRVRGCQLARLSDATTRLAS